jgi:hypothetical protein
MSLARDFTSSTYSLQTVSGSAVPVTESFSVPLLLPRLPCEIQGTGLDQRRAVLILTVPKNSVKKRASAGRIVLRIACPPHRLCQLSVLAVIATTQMTALHQQPEGHHPPVRSHHKGALCALRNPSTRTDLSPHTAPAAWFTPRRMIKCGRYYACALLPHRNLGAQDRTTKVRHR